MLSKQQSEIETETLPRLSVSRNGNEEIKGEAMKKNTYRKCTKD